MKMDEVAEVFETGSRKMVNLLLDEGYDLMDIQTVHRVQRVEGKPPTILRVTQYIVARTNEQRPFADVVLEDGSTLGSKVPGMRSAVPA